jgi:hypothetical protein
LAFILVASADKLMNLTTPSIQITVRAVAALVVLAGGLSTALGANLFVNGNFEAGNSGFGSDLSYDASPPFTLSGTYAVTTDPMPWFPSDWVSMGDHTTGAGQMFLTTPNPGPTRIWFETATVAAGTTYTLSGWTARVSIDDFNIAKLSIAADNTSLGVFDVSVLPIGAWGEFSFDYTASSSGPVVFSITDLATSNTGNDLVLDDLSVVPVPEPGPSLFVVGAIVFLARGRAGVISFAAGTYNRQPRRGCPAA